MSENPEADATRGRCVINHYRSLTGTDPEMAAVDLIADVLHALTEESSVDHAVKVAHDAIEHFQTERELYPQLDDSDALDQIVELIEAANTKFGHPSYKSRAHRIEMIVNRTGRKTRQGS